MKPAYIRSIIALVLLGLTSASCGGGGGGGGGVASLHAPSISSLYFYPDTVTQNEGGGTVFVDFSFDFADAGGDLASMTLTVSDSTGNVLYTGSEPFQDAFGITAGYIDGYLSADTTVAGAFTIDFSLADSQGSVSNKLTATFTVIPPQQPVNIEVSPADPPVVQGATRQFTAKATYPDTTVVNVTAQAVWSSSDTGVATIDAAGLATCKSTGATTITATFGGTSGSAVLTVVAGFSPGVGYLASDVWLGNTAIGDLNGDGRNDVAVIDAQSAFAGIDSILVYFQNSGHTLDTPQEIAADLTLKGIAIADVNNDGLADLIVSGNSTTATAGGRIAVYRQDGSTHALASPQYYAVSTDSIAGLAVADLNNDTLPDIVSSGTGTGGTGVVSFLFQGSNSALGPEVLYTSVAVYSGGELHAADMNNDGLNDVVLQSGPLQLAVIKQVSAGTFSTVPEYYTVQTSYWSSFNSFALGDLNSDGATDMAAIDIGNDSYLNIFLQNGSGQLTRQTLSHYNASEVHIADIDGDGRNDILLLADGKQVRILYQSAQHAFTAPFTYAFPTGGSGGTVFHQVMSIGDVTGDGLPDLVASWVNEGLFVLPHLP